MLEGFAQVHTHLYFAEPLPIHNIAEDLRKLAPSLQVDNETLKAKLSGCQYIDSRSVGGDEREFVYAHRLIDTVAIRYVRNETAEAGGWTERRETHKQVMESHQHIHLGLSTLLQCEGDVSSLGENGLRSALRESLANSPDYLSLSLGSCAVLPFGYLFELETDETVWLLVNKSSEERAVKWVTVDWLRLITFLKKHSHYRILFERGMSEMDEVIAAIEAGKVKPQFNPDRASVLLESSRDECEVMCNNLEAAEKGYSNAFDDTVGFGMSPAARVEQHFLLRIVGQLHWSTYRSRKRFASLRDRWPRIERSINIAKPKVRGDFFWSSVEEATIVRYVDCRCSVIATTLEQIIMGRGKGFGPYDDPEGVARNIYDWLRGKENIIYELEPVQPQRVAQLIRKHSDTVKHGTCIDLSCHYAALLEGARQRPVLVHYVTWVGPNRDDWQAHMVCGLWLNGSSFSGDELICKDVDELQQHIRNDNLLIVECMGFAKGDKKLIPILDATFDDTIQTGGQEVLVLKKQGSAYFNFAIDIEKCRNKDFDIQAIQQD